MTSHRLVITAEYVNAHFFLSSWYLVLLFVYALKVLMVLFYANFRKLG